MVLKKVLKYETYVIAGILLIVLAFLKAMNIINISSDWFWFIAGVALTIEGILDLSKQKQFKEKYKVVSKKEYEEMKKNK